MIPIEMNCLSGYLSIEMGASDSIDQINGELNRLLVNDGMHFHKRRKVLLQLERQNNQSRRMIDRLDLENQRKFTHNSELIRQIKKKIIEEQRQENQRRRDEHEENRTWSLGGTIIAMALIVVGIITIATVIGRFLHRSKEKYI